VKVGLYAGSFDPVHLGHLWVIEEATRLFDRLVVAVIANPQKSSGMFRPDERLQLLAETTRHLPSVRALTFHGLTVELARLEGVTALVRAAHKDTRDELSMSVMNQALGAISTVFVHPSPHTWTISSSQVRQLVEAGKVVEARQLVPPPVRDALTRVAARA
jgi:pantetheine-phosphate adenylyltransferase